MRPLLVALGLILAALLALALVRVDQPSTALRQSVLNGSNHGRPAELLANAGISAERLCVFGPYTATDTINEVLGFDWPTASTTGIASTDVEELVVAANSNSVAAWAMVPRGSADSLRPDGYGCSMVAPLDS